MADPTHQPWILKEDGTLDADFVAQRIVFQSSLNVLLLFGENNEVCVVDTNSGNILQKLQLAGELESGCVIVWVDMAFAPYLSVCVCVWESWARPKARAL